MRVKVWGILKWNLGREFERVKEVKISEWSGRKLEESTTRWSSLTFLLYELTPDVAFGSNAATWLGISPTAQKQLGDWVNACLCSASHQSDGMCHGRPSNLQPFEAGVVNQLKRQQQCHPTGQEQLILGLSLVSFPILIIVSGCTYIRVLCASQAERRKRKMIFPDAGLHRARITTVLALRDAKCREIAVCMIHNFLILRIVIQFPRTMRTGESPLRFQIGRAG